MEETVLVRKKSASGLTLIIQLLPGLCRIARTVQKLEKNRYVEKRKDKNDKRVKRIYLTKKAKKLKQSIEDARNDLMDILFNGISDDEFQAYINVLEKMYENLKRESVEEENTHG